MQLLQEIETASFQKRKDKKFNNYHRRKNSSYLSRCGYSHAIAGLTLIFLVHINNNVAQKSGRKNKRTGLFDR